MNFEADALARAVASAREEMAARQQSALAMYRVHRDAHALDTYRLLTYRCARRCLLLDLFRTPAGPAMYFPPFRLSPEQTAAHTAESARITRTTDGVRRWIERAEMLHALEGLAVHLNCDHVSRHLLPHEEIRESLDAGTRQITVTSSGP